MGVNANPRVRVTAVIGDTSKNVQGRGFRGRSGICLGGKQSESPAQREAFERRIENELGFQLAVQCAG